MIGNGMAEASLTDCGGCLSNHSLDRIDRASNVAFRTMLSLLLHWGTS